MDASRHNACRYRRICPCSPIEKLCAGCRRASRDAVRPVQADRKAREFTGYAIVGQNDPFGNRIASGQGIPAAGRADCERLSQVLGRHIDQVVKIQRGIVSFSRDMTIYDTLLIRYAIAGDTGPIQRNLPWHWYSRARGFQPSGHRTRSKRPIGIGIGSVRRRPPRLGIRSADRRSIRDRPPPEPPSLARVIDNVGRGQERTIRLAEKRKRDAKNPAKVSRRKIRCDFQRYAGWPFPLSAWPGWERHRHRGHSVLGPAFAKRS